ncbi:MAG: class I SAM-dependent methyltransferase [candidate division WOR-3 bacterium]
MRKALKIIELIKKGERPEYIFKKCLFLDEEFYIEKKVLIPREETSLLVNYLKELKEKKLKPEIIIDFGTGTGILAIWAKRIFPFSCVLAVDFLKKACRCAKINSRKKKAKIKVIRTKSFKIFKKEKIDLIISNPPYLSEEEYKKYGPFKGESKKSLLGGKKGYEVFLKWLKEAFEVLKRGGIFISEISEFWDKDILSGFKKYLIDERKDFFNKNRIWIFKKF